jgi:hypothetical protein
MTCTAITGARLPPALLPPIVTTPSVMQVAMSYSIMLLPLYVCPNRSTVNYKSYAARPFRSVLLTAYLLHQLAQITLILNSYLLSFDVLLCVHVTTAGHYHSGCKA